MCGVEDALARAAEGWAVFPLHTVDDAGRCSCGQPDCTGNSRGKHPLHNGWKQEATQDPARIRALWAPNARANVGMLTGRTMVDGHPYVGPLAVDIDPRNGGLESFQALVAELGEPPPTRWQKTGSGGVHYFFDHPQVIGNAKLAEGIDLKGAGGYVVGPGSRHWSGGVYEYGGDPRTPISNGEWISKVIEKAGHGPTRAPSSPGAAPPLPPDLVTGNAPGLFPLLDAEILQLRSALVAIPSDDYDLWIHVGMALQSRVDTPVENAILLDLWAEWSELGRRYPVEAGFPKNLKSGGQRGSEFPGRDVIEKKWRTFRGSGINLGTLYHHAREHGWAPPPPPVDPSSGMPLPVLPIGARQHREGYDQFGLVGRFRNELETVANVVTDEGQLWQYRPATGNWHPNDTLFQRVLSWDGELYENKKGDPVCFRPDDQLLERTSRLLIKDTQKRGFFLFQTTADKEAGVTGPPPSVITFANGTVDLTGRLTPHSPLHRSRFRIRVPFDPEAGCPKWLYFLQEIFGAYDDYVARVSVLQEFMGAIITGSAPRFQKALLLLGYGNNGKSQIINVCEALVATENQTAVSLNDLNSEYWRAALAQSLLNVSTELPTRELNQSTMFKAMVDGSQIGGRVIQVGMPFFFRPRAAQLYACNELPPIGDLSDGHLRRWLILTFDRTQPSETVFPELGSYIVANELPGIAAWCFRGALRLQAQKKYSRCPSSDIAVAEWRADSDQVCEFAGDLLEADPDPKVPCRLPWYTVNDVLARRYQDWASAMGYGRLGSKTLGKRLRRLGFLPHRDSQSRGFRLRFKK